MVKNDYRKYWTEDFEYHGNFFMPEYEDNPISGKIKYSKGFINLTLFEPFHDPRHYITVRQNIAHQREPEFSSFDILLGTTNDGTKITLANCHLTNRNTSHHTADTHTYYETSVYTVSYLLVGRHYNNWSEIKFNSLNVEYSNFNEWLHKSAIDYDLDLSSDWKEKIEFVPITPPEGPLYEDLRYRIHFNVKKDTGSNPLYKGSFEQNASLEIHGDILRKLSELSTLHNRLKNLIHIGIFYKMPLVLIMEGKINEDFAQHIYIYHTNDVIHRISTPIDYYNMFFTFDVISHCLPFLFTKWLRNFEKYKEVYSLYFDTLWYEAQPRETEFNNLVQTLEGYNRIKYRETKFSKSDYKTLLRNIRNRCSNSDERKLIKRIKNIGNEPTLKERLFRLTNEFRYIFESQEAQSKLIKKITATRNYLTHREPSLQINAASYEETYYLIQKLHTIIVSTMILDLSFSDIEQKELIKKYNEKRRRFRLI